MSYLPKSFSAERIEEEIATLTEDELERVLLFIQALQSGGDTTHFFCT